LEARVNTNSGKEIMLISGVELMGIEKARLALSSAGYEVLCVDSGETKAALVNHQPDLIVANLSGYQPSDLELCQQLKRFSQAPIIAIDSAVDEAFRVGMIEFLVDDFITRPVNTRELLARVRNILRRTQSALPQSISEELKSDFSSPNKQDAGLKTQFYNLIKEIPQRITHRRSING
jgi:DNA-binding response OmpR family regulator